VAILARRLAERRKAAAEAVTPHQKVFAASRLVLTGNGKTPVSGFGHAKATLDARIAALCVALDRKPMPPWRTHDIRRTVATHMAEAGVAPHVVEAVLNHISGTRAGVAGVYNRAAYLPERRAALEAWAEKITALASQSARPDPYAA
jgi:integrase